MKNVFFPLFLLGLFISGCAMVSAWKTIPPPGGCNQCHVKQISADWVATIAPATINTETGRYSWQMPESTLPPESSPLDERKVQELKCFRCHKGPDKKHIEYSGSYHH